MKLTELFLGLLRWLAFTTLLLTLLFGLTGRTDLPMFWAYAGVQSLLALAAVLTIDPDLARERRHPGPGGVDRMRPLWIGFLYFAHLVIAALDVGHFHWSDRVPPEVRMPALFLFAASMALVVWAMAVNRFFSPVVRIQSERSHHLVTSGPYGAVRHPGYLGFCFWLPASGLALGSWAALVPAGICSLLIIRRAALEDRYLRQNLDGYARYAERVRYRLIPGVW